MYIAHVTLTTAHTLPRHRGEVGDATMAIIVPWLRAAIGVGKPIAIPERADYQAHALAESGALVVTIYSPQPEIGTRIPLVSFGVCARSRAAGPLWRMLTAMPGVVPDLPRPSVPWCAVVLHPTLPMHPEAAEWLADFEHAVAWAWVTRNPDIRAMGDA